MALAHPAIRSSSSNLRSFSLRLNHASSVMHAQAAVTEFTAVRLQKTPMHRRSSKSLDLTDLMGCVMAFNQIYQVIAIASLRIARFLLCSIWTEDLDEDSLGTEHAPLQAFR